MIDTHPYPQDITADPFFVFGGLFSRKVITTYVASLKPSKPTVFSQIIDIADNCASEIALQQGIEDILNNHGVACRKPKPSNGDPRCDRIIKDKLLVEIKLDTHKFDPQSWNGSQEDENAIEQVKRYFSDSSAYEWAILTNGKVVRIMHRDHGFNYIDIWICDTNRHGKTKQATFLESILNNVNLLDSLKQKSDDERKRFNLSFEANVQEFWDRNKALSKKTWNVSLVEAVLLIAFYRYLEDCGILPIMSLEYLPFNMNSIKDPDEIMSCFASLRRQQFITKDVVPENTGIFSDETLERVRNVLSKKALYSGIIGLFYDNDGAVDLSDLSISFFGDAYQIFANKTDINGVEGQYFTGSSLARDAAMYFVEDERRGLSEGEIIFDPFVGSGQLLRALVPFFHVLLQGEVRSPSIIGGMRTLVLRLAGVDVDPNACWLARLSLAFATSEKGKPLLDLSDKIKRADVFSTCFGYTESKWMAALDIKGTVRG